jgi:hypothetical protein
MFEPIGPSDQIRPREREGWFILIERQQHQTPFFLFPPSPFHLPPSISVQTEYYLPVLVSIVSLVLNGISSLGLLANFAAARVSLAPTVILSIAFHFFKMVSPHDHNQTVLCVLLLQNGLFSQSSWTVLQSSNVILVVFYIGLSLQSCRVLNHSYLCLKIFELQEYKTISSSSFKHRTKPTQIVFTGSLHYAYLPPVLQLL